MRATNYLQGRYRLRVATAEGKIRHDTGWIDNLVLDQGLDFPGKYDNYVGFCHVGLGNDPALVTDTTLNTFHVSIAKEVGTDVSAQGSAPYYASKVFHYHFDSGVVGAETVTEVGVGRTLATGELFSRIVLQEAIVMLATEILYVDYELRLYPDHLIKTDIQIDISLTTYDVEILACNVSSTAYWSTGIGDIFDGLDVALWRCWETPSALGPVTGTPTGVEILGAEAGATSNSKGTFSDGTYELDVSSLWGFTKANAVGGVGSLLIATGSGTYQLTFSPALPKTILNELRLTWKQSWARKIL